MIDDLLDVTKRTVGATGRYWKSLYDIPKSVTYVMDGEDDVWIFDHTPVRGPKARTIIRRGDFDRMGSKFSWIYLDQTDVGSRLRTEQWGPFIEVSDPHEWFDE